VLKVSLTALFVISLTLTFSVAGTTAIGTASARGSIRVDGALVNGNATLFDGTVIETDVATTAVRLDKGVEIKLATDSRGTFYRDRLVLEKGSTELVRPGSFRLEASRLRVTPDSPDARGVVSMKDDRTVEVSALSGELWVSTNNGLLLARVEPGRMLAFNDQQAAGATAPTTVTGVLTKEEDKCAATHEKKYYVTVKETGVRYEVTGTDLDKLVGKVVTLTGTPDPNVQPSKCAAGLIVASSAAAVAGAVAAGAAAGTIAGIVTTHLIIAGVVVAAAAGTGVGLYEANKGPSSASP